MRRFGLRGGENSKLKVGFVFGQAERDFHDYS
jgi:hypothetical protein